MTGFNLLEQLRVSRNQSGIVTLEELKNETRRMIEYRNHLTEQIWKIKLDIVKCDVNDTEKLIQLNDELSMIQEMLEDDDDVAELLEELQRREIEELGDSQIGCDSPYPF
jgi:hypothetical protein